MIDLDLYSLHKIHKNALFLIYNHFQYYKSGIYNFLLFLRSLSYLYYIKIPILTHGKIRLGTLPLGKISTLLSVVCCYCICCSYCSCLPILCNILDPMQIIPNTTTILLESSTNKKNLNKQTKEYNFQWSIHFSHNNTFSVASSR